MSIRSRVLFVVIFFSLLSALTLTHADEWGTIVIPPHKPIKIGLGAMLTGDYASMGIDIKNGAEMAVEEKGAILGQRVVLQAEDDGWAGLLLCHFEPFGFAQDRRSEKSYGQLYPG